MGEASQPVSACGDEPMHRLQRIERPRPGRGRRLRVLRGPIEVEIGAPKRRPLRAVAALDRWHDEVRQVFSPARARLRRRASNAAARRLYDAVAERTGFIQYRIDPP